MNKLETAKALRNREKRRGNVFDGVNEIKRKGRGASSSQGRGKGSALGGNR